MNKPRTQHSRWVPRIDAGRRLDLFLIAAVSTVLGVRLYLEASGYPQISGGELHVAHLLWGGLFMLAAIVMTLGYVGRRLNTMAAVVGGIGFGLFIDEIGKFVTKDNDYFYQPAIALIYVVFVALYIAIRKLTPRHPLGTNVALANALEIASEAVINGWTAQDRASALHLLAHCEAGDPLVAHLKATLAMIPVEPPRRTTSAHIADRVQTIARRCLAAPWFRWVLATICLIKIGEIVGWTGTVIGSVITGQNSFGSPLMAVLAIITTLTAAFGIGYGFRLLRRGDRRTAYALFTRIAWLSAFLVSLLSFYWNQFGGVIDLGLNLAFVFALQQMLNATAPGDEEQSRAAPRRPGPLPHSS